MKPAKLFVSEKTLFRDETVFEPGYVPETVLYRDAELQTLSSCIAPALRGGRPTSVLIQGNPATGKTTAIKYVFEQLRDYSSKIVLVHVNCRVSSTPYKILSEVHKQLFGYAPPDTGVPKARIYEKICTSLAKDRKSLVLALDDINYLLLSHDVDEVLSSILRASEVFSGVRTCIWATTHTELMHHLDTKNRSLFQPERILFRNYTADQITQILAARASVGLADGVMSQLVIKTIAGQSSDVRQALEILRQSVIKAEQAGSSRVEQHHIHVQPFVPVLDARESLVLQIVQSGLTEAGSIYDQCRISQQMSYSTFYRTLQKLKTMQLLDINHVGKQQGRTSMVTLRT